MEFKYIWHKYLQKTIASLIERPMYIQTCEKHQNRVILVTSEQELVDSMMKLTKNWYDSHWLPREDWYFAGTFEEFFLKEMGVPLNWFEEHIGYAKKQANHNLEAFVEQARNIRCRYQYHVEGIKDAKLISDILKNGIVNRNNELYNLLNDLSYNNSKMFELKSFD